ncbi:MAG: hypothetical protein ACXW2F_11790 [Thermoanaerobaculia bacterium]
MKRIESFRRAVLLIAGLVCRCATASNRCQRVPVISDAPTAVTISRRAPTIPPSVKLILSLHDRVN